MKLLSFKALREEKGIQYSRVHLYRLMNASPPQFPKPIHCGGNRVAFLESEIDAWIKSKIAERDAKEAA